MFFLDKKEVLITSSPTETLCYNILILLVKIGSFEEVKMFMSIFWTLLKSRKPTSQIKYGKEGDLDQNETLEDGFGILVLIISRSGEQNMLNVGSIPNVKRLNKSAT